MEKGYVALCPDVESSHLQGTATQHHSSNLDRYSFCWPLFVVILICTNVFTYLHKSSTANDEKKIPESYAHVKPLPEMYTPFHWYTVYGSHNHTRDDQLWDAIKPSHGFVALDREAATDQRLPVSMYLPSDESKGVYLLEAYHLLHCLKSIRAAFKRVLESGQHELPSQHEEHCFGALRQSIMCHADNLPLYTFGDNTVGDGQMHQCRSWDALREFATQNTACYRDTDGPVLLGEHFGYCDDGDDGLIWPIDGLDY